jgi:hypothetical protein
VTQTRLQSLIEALVNMVIGFGLSLLVNQLVLPMFGYDVKLGESLIIVTIFTVVSIIRSYTLRRVFNRLTRRQ